MQCRIADLRCKEVINSCTGMRLGYVSDVCVNTVTGQVASIIVPGCCSLFGFFGREDDIVIPWECIRRIGDDLIIVEISGDFCRDSRRKCRR